MTWAKPERQADADPVVLDGSQGEGGGQILRTAISLSILTGRPFQMDKIRAKRPNPGLRAAHLMAVRAAAEWSAAEVRGAEVGSQQLWFRPGDGVPRDLTIDIGTAGSTALVLQTLYLPIAMSSQTTRVVDLQGGTFNPMAPPYPFLENTWREYLKRFGLSVELTMPSAGFYPRGGGRMIARLEPGFPQPWVSKARGRLLGIRGTAGVCNLSLEIAKRMQRHAISLLKSRAVDIEIDVVAWPGPGTGTAISLTADYEGCVPATFLSLGERGKKAEAVADEAVDEWLAFDNVPDAAVDPHSADQILLPLALADGPSAYSVSEVTEHLRTNAKTIHKFLGRSIRIQEVGPGQVVID